MARVAIIGGTGEEGSGLGARWARAGWDVVIGSRDAGRAEVAATELLERVPGACVAGALNEEAAAEADTIVVTVPFAGQAATYKAIAPHVRDDAIVVDCTAPLAAAVGGRAAHVLGVWQGSAAQQAAALLEHGTVSAAFHSLSASSLVDLDSDLDGDVLVCGPRAAKGRVAELVEAIPRLRAVDAGPLDNARLVEPLTALLIGINRRYGTDRAGVRITGLPG
jgi:8-hydroxy-5-deazaflavin:NADPH oxidoreductase